MTQGMAEWCAGIIIGANAPYSVVGAQAVRIFDPVGQNYSQVAVMQSLRWYPTVMTFPDGNMLIIGGAQAVSLSLLLRCNAWEVCPLSTNRTSTTQVLLSYRATALNLHQFVNTPLFMDLWGFRPFEHWLKSHWQSQGTALMQLYTAFDWVLLCQQETAAWGITANPSTLNTNQAVQCSPNQGGGYSVSSDCVIISGWLNLNLQSMVSQDCFIQLSSTFALLFGTLPIWLQSKMCTMALGF